MNLKKGLVLFVSAALALAMAACGGGKSSSTPAGPASGTTFTVTSSAQFKDLNETLQKNPKITAVDFTQVNWVPDQVLKGTSVTKVTVASGTTVTGQSFAGAKGTLTIAVTGRQAVDKAILGGASSALLDLSGTSLSDIGEMAFYNSDNLIGVALPESLKTIGSSAFASCSGLAGVQLPAGLQTIRSGAFAKCTSLAKINLPAGLQTVEESAFAGCTSLTSVSWPAGVKTVENDVFAGCTGLTSVTLPDTVEQVKHRAFQNCTRLTGIKLPAGLKTIGEYAFENCAGLASIQTPASLEKMETGAFRGCTGLTRMDLGSSTRLGALQSGVLRGCTRLSQLILPNAAGNFTIGSESLVEGAARLDLCVPNEQMTVYIVEGALNGRTVTLYADGNTEALAYVFEGIAGTGADGSVEVKPISKFPGGYTPAGVGLFGLSV